VVVLDPNSDFVRLDQLRSDADPVLAGRFGALCNPGCREWRAARARRTGLTVLLDEPEDVSIGSWRFLFAVLPCCPAARQLEPATC